MSLERLAAAPAPPPFRQPLVTLVLDGLSALIGRPRGAVPLETVIAGAVPTVAGVPREQLLVGGIALAVGHDRAAADLAEAAVADARAQGRIGWLPNLLFVLAEARLFLGHHRDGLRDATEGARIADATGQDQWRGELASLEAWVAAIEGAVARCRERADAVLADRDGPGTDRAGWALGLLDLGQGRAGDALARLVPLAEGPSWYGLAATRCVPDLVEAAARLGEPERADAAFDRFAGWAGRVGRPWADALVLRCRALRATPAGEDGVVERLYLAALARHERDRRPFDRARTELLYGEWLRRARRKTDAGARLRAAVETFERIGARPWAARAAGELAAAGLGTAGAPATAGRPGTTGRPGTAGAGPGTAGAGPGDVGSGRRAPAGSAGPVPGWPGLTPREGQIVRLAARGLSNREIAAQLFLSPRTVGYHLYKAYPKLGVQSRAELGRVEPPGSEDAW
jgi:DNA-binding CsgD family transcriptional regulator